MSWLGTLREHLGLVSRLPEPVAQYPMAESYDFPMQLFSLLRVRRGQSRAANAPDLGGQLDEAPVHCIEPVLLASCHAKA